MREGVEFYPGVIDKEAPFRSRFDPSPRYNETQLGSSYMKLMQTLAKEGALVDENMNKRKTRGGGPR